MSQNVEFLSSVGRIVWGHPLTPTIKKDQRSKLPVLREGKEVQQWSFGLAIEKGLFVANEWPHMQKAAALVFPNGIPSNFSWKYKDGDTVDKKGKPYSLREGHGGHYILTVSTESFAPQVFKRESNGTFRQIEAHEIKRGDYVRVQLNLKANSPSDSTQTPGIFVNPKGIELVGYGTEITSGGVDPDEAFATPVAQLPQGASLTPIAPVGGAMPPNMMHNANAAPLAPQPPAMAPAGMPQQGYPANPMAPTGYPAPQPPAMAPAAPQGMPPPHNEFINNAGMPQPPMGNGAPSAAAGYPAPPNYAGAPATPATGYPSNPAAPQGMPAGMPPGMPQR